jgi:hypothetical protein
MDCALQLWDRGKALVAMLQDSKPIISHTVSVTSAEDKEKLKLVDPSSDSQADPRGWRALGANIQ